MKKKHFVPQDLDNEPAKEYKTEQNEVDELAGVPAEAPFRDPMAPVNDDKIIEIAME